MHRCVISLTVLLFTSCPALGLFDALADERRPTMDLAGIWEVYAVPWERGLAEFDPDHPRDQVLVPQYGFGAGPHGTGKDLTQGSNSCYWLTKTVDVPADFAGRHVMLVFRHAMFSVEAFVNGRPVGHVQSVYTPFHFDVTRQIKPGQANTIRVRLRDWRAGATAKGVERYKGSPAYGYSNKPPGTVGYPVNMQFDALPGFRDDVYLVALNDVSVADAFVRPSYRNRQLIVDVTLQNLSTSAQQVAMQCDIAEAVRGRAALTFDEQPVVLDAGQTKVVTLRRDWPDAHLWSPSDPFLYRASVRIRRDGQELDEAHQRFGFREVWVDGAKLMMNGYPIKLFQLGTFLTAGKWFHHDRAEHRRRIRDFYQRDVLDMNMNSVRWTGGTIPDIYMTVADEMGVLITVEPDTTHCFGADFLSEVFWGRVYTVAKAMAKLYRNHPSVVIYAGGNEILIHAYHKDEQEVTWAMDRYFHIQQVLHDADPTRPVMFEGNGDLGGRDVDIYNVHAYEPEDCRQWPVYTFDAKLLAGQLNLGKQSDPVADFWGGRKVLLSQTPWASDKPVCLGEMFSFYKLPMEALTYIRGEDIYRGMHADAAGYYGAAADLLVNLVAGYRHHGVTAVDPWYLFALADHTPVIAEAQRTAYKPVGFYVYDQFSRYFADRDVTRTIVCFNDAYDPKPADINVEWTLAHGDRTIQRDSTRIAALPTGSSPKVALPLHTPAEPGDYEMTIRMVRNGKPADEQTVPMRICRDQSADPIDTAGRRIAVYDPVGRTTKILAKRVSQLQNLTAPTPPDDADVMVVGEGAYDASCTAHSEAIGGWVQRGGRLLLLGQTYIGDPLNIDLTAAPETAYTSFIRAKGHPAFDGLRDEDVLTWARDFKVAYQPFRKSWRGAFRCLADTGYGHDGLVYSVLTEQTHGRGRILYCQYRIVERYDVEPAAQQMLGNMVRYLCTAPDAEPTKIALASDDQRFADMLSSFGATVDDVLGEASELKDAVLMVDGASAEAAQWLRQNLDRVRSHLDAGGTVFVDSLEPVFLGALNALLGADMKLNDSQIVIPHLEYGAGERDPLLWGLSLFDLTWDKYSPPFYTERLVTHTIDRASCPDDAIPLLIEPARVGRRTDNWCKFFAVSPQRDDNRANENAGYSLVKLPVGRGTVYLSMLRLRDGYFGLERPKAQRIVCTLLNNLGVSMDIDRVVPELVYPVRPEHFLPVGGPMPGKGFQTRFISMANKDRVRWTFEKLRQRDYRITFKVALGGNNPGYIPVQFFLDGRPLEVAGPMDNYQSVLKGDTWEFFGGDVPIKGVHGLSDQSVIEAEAQGNWVLIYNLTLTPAK